MSLRLARVKGLGGVRRRSGARFLMVCVSALLYLAALLHVIASLGPQPPPPSPEHAELARMMSELPHSFPLFQRTTDEFLTGYSVSWALLVMFAATLNLVLLRRSRTARELRTLALIDAVFLTALAGISATWLVTAPILAFGLPALLALLVAAVSADEPGTESA